MSGLTGYLLKDGITDLSNVFLGKSSIVNNSGNNTFSGTNTFNGVVKCNSQFKLSYKLIDTTPINLSSPISFFYLINISTLTINLPNPSTTPGSMILFKRFLAGTTTYNVTGGGTSIYGLSSTSPVSSLALTTLNIQFFCDETFWFVIHSV